MALDSSLTARAWRADGVGARAVSAPPDRPQPAVPTPAGVWRADALDAGAAPAFTTGHAALDAALPGGGWPLGALVELLPATDDGGVPVWPLLLPALAAHRVGQGAGTVVLVGAPASPRPAADWQPGLPALAAAGLSPARQLWLPCASPVARLWAAEQALRCADVAAVLAWLPQARASDLRRLQLAAARRGDGLLFVLRPAQAARTASPAPLRLRLGVDVVASTLVVHVVKRRGPPLVAPLHLPAQSAAVRALLAAAEQARAAAAARVLPFAPRPDRPDAAREVDHAVDRVAVAA